MNQKLLYHETTIDFDRDPFIAAAQMARNITNQDYVLYENSEEWSLGFGIHAHLAVYPESLVLTTPAGQQRFENSDLSTTIHNALAEIAVEDWRAYGIANFELARYNYVLGLQSPKTLLLKMFIPEAEVRFSEKSIHLRALDPDTLARLKKRLDEILEQFPSSLEGARVLTKHDLPEINTYAAEKYMTMVADAVQEIKEHHYRKVILSRKIPISRKIDMVDSFITGRLANTPARSYLLNLDGLKAAGFSPETVVEVTDAGDVYTTPLAGTRALGSDPMERVRLHSELVSDSKEIAEHALSVYVALDEMKLVCEEKTVSVIEFMDVLRRGTVQHLASRLKGKLMESCSAWHAFNAFFPAVTASGVPKRESIEAIKRFEPGPRGLYSGCVITHDQAGRFDAALVLRTFFQDGEHTWLQAGAGIMDMSRPERELEETREKLYSCSNYLVPSHT